MAISSFSKISNSTTFTLITNSNITGWANKVDAFGTRRAEKKTSRGWYKQKNPHFWIRNKDFLLGPAGLEPATNGL
jgi:hypothetical protein